MADPESSAFPFTPEQWARLAATLRLSPRQKRVVELILSNCCDKQIAADMKLRLPTIRTYLTRIFHRLGVGDRLELVLRLCALSHGRGPAPR